MAKLPSPFEVELPSPFEVELPSPSPTKSPLTRAADRWLSDGKAQGHSRRTLDNRRHMLNHFEWWLVHEEGAPAALSSLSPARIRGFLSYLREECPAGRFGSRNANARAPVRPSTAHTYYRCLRTFANFLLAEGDLETTPLRNVKAPRVPNDQVQPFTADQVQALLAAARLSPGPERNSAIVLLLLDTGMRASELCGLSIRDCDTDSGALSVLGKGNKRRQVYVGAAARRALHRYLSLDRKAARQDDPLFVGLRGRTPGAPLTPSGLFQIIQQLGRAARLPVAAGCHKLRHTFAVNFLRGGGNLFELQQLMGHEDLTVLRRYVMLAESDLENAHRKASPGDRMGVR